MTEENKKKNDARKVMVIHPLFSQPQCYQSLKQAARELGSMLNSAFGTLPENYVSPEVINFLLKSGMELHGPHHPLHGLRVLPNNIEEEFINKLKKDNSSNSLTHELNNSITYKLDNSITHEFTNLIESGSQNLISPLNSIYQSPGGKPVSECTAEDVDIVFSDLT